MTPTEERKRGQHCPTCGHAVKVVGDTTQHYEPVGCFRTPTEVVYEVTAESVIHRCPPVGSGLMPCCERTPFEVPRWHRLTEDEGLVTCGRTDV